MMSLEFTELVKDILATYPSENPVAADVLSEQISAIVSFDHELNGYGAYSNFTIRTDVRRLPPGLSRGYLPNGFYVQMEGREFELGFVLSCSEAGFLACLEIYPNDGVGWDGVVRKYRLVKLTDLPNKPLQVTR